jgi:hypothetical protein
MKNNLVLADYNSGQVLSHEKSAIRFHPGIGSML